MLKLYNTLSRKKEIFKPLKPKNIGLYTCGPTVYNYAHIGNLRTYVFEDVLERVLSANGYKVKRVMNITDVGHLTSDADSGEDKIDREAKVSKKTPAEIAQFYTKVFFDDLKKLDIKIPGIIAPATDYVPDQIKLAEQLFKKGYAYETPQALYFDVSKFKNYGRLSGKSLKQKITAARKEVVEDPGKRNPADFALWFKTAGRFKNHLQRWPSPWGEGFPGWHIECSAISRKFLGQPFDIHTGGVDHIGTHHENEIAQSEAAFGKPLAKYWLHGEHLSVNGGKMSKSLGNFYTLQDIIDKNFDPLAFRYLVLTSHYRSKLNFTMESLKAADNALNNLRNFLSAGENKKIRADKKITGKFEEGFLAAINDDLNTPRALAIVWEIIKNRKTPFSAKKRLILGFDKILGLSLKTAKTAKIPAKIEEIAKEREELRRNKQFIKADALRKEMERLGYVIEDTAYGTQITPARH
ncbi:MAG: cysteine--tRNA ligase [Candidatus Wolfebacteria bacterium]|nr:cysteine--tRNA ligase [Candidatus Wolfebacteria bacterium]